MIALLSTRGWQAQHHVRLPSGGIIDIVAVHDGKKYVIECKVRLTKGKLYEAIGQVLCYCCEYDTEAIPAIASYHTEFDEYTRQCCERFRIAMIEVEHTAKLTR